MLSHTSVFSVNVNVNTRYNSNSRKRSIGINRDRRAPTEHEALKSRRKPTSGRLAARLAVTASLSLSLSPCISSPGAFPPFSRWSLRFLARRAGRAASDKRLKTGRKTRYARRYAYLPYKVSLANCNDYERHKAPALRDALLRSFRRDSLSLERWNVRT